MNYFSPVPLIPICHSTDVAYILGYDARVDNGARRCSERLNRKWQQIKDTICPNYTPQTEYGTLLFKIAMKQLKLPLKKSVRAMARFNIWFHRSSFQAMRKYKIRNTSASIIYIPIWKCGNQNNRFYWNKTFEEVERGDSHNNLNDNENSCIVTAIQDPISHSLLGYKEIEVRW